MHIKGFFRLNNEAKELLELLGYKESFKKFSFTYNNIGCYSRFIISPEYIPFFQYLPSSYPGIPGEVILTEKGKHFLSNNIVKLTQKGKAANLEQTEPLNAQKGKERKMIKKIENMDENALIDLALLRDYTGKARKFTDEEQMEFERLWRMVPPSLFEAAAGWGIDVYELIYKTTHAWLEIQNGPGSPILIVRKEWVGLGLTMEKEKEEEVRVELRLLYTAGYTYFKTLKIIADEMRYFVKTK